KTTRRIVCQRAPSEQNVTWHWRITSLTHSDPRVSFRFTDFAFIFDQKRLQISLEPTHGCARARSEKDSAQRSSSRTRRPHGRVWRLGYAGAIRYRDDHRTFAHAH